MNTSCLKQKFPKIYQEFFSKCHKVASAPHSFFWTGDFSGFYGGLTVLSKLPLRFYVGLQQIEQKRFEVDDEFYAYIPQNHKFSKIKLESYIVDNLKQLLSTKLSGFRIHFLSEITLGASLGGLGAISASLAKLIDEKDTFKLAWEISKKIQRGRTNGATVFAATTESTYPIVFYSKGVKYWGKPLDQIFSLPSSPVWPIDFGLIFSGTLVQGAAVIASAEEVQNVLEQREKQIKKALKSDFENSFWKTYINMLNQIASQNLIAFSEIFKKGSQDTALEFFFSTLNQYQNLLYFLDISTPAIDKIYSKIHKMANKEENNTGSGCKLTGVGKGGEVLFALPFGQYRDKVLSPNLDYASWVDGFEKNGVKIEQDLESKTYSQFIPKNSYLLKVIEKSKFEIKIVGESDLEKARNDVDLFLDTVSDKVYLSGRGIKSNALPSQKATIEIMKKLLESKDKILYNKDLPRTYAENRYDLQGKITTPLSRLTNLKFEISGKMYENYTLKLSPFDISIGILEKIV
ncbi:MAG: hypothetical protein NT135_01005 [Candidatus Berkelbacteria bacterium]|nr:hypothetical protein [Candidatus Berkelbacteria bacterium]